MLEHSDQSARRLAAIVDSSDDAIVSKDLNGIVQSWNQAAERVFGFTADEMIGTSIRRIIPQDRQSEEETVLQAIRAGRRVEHFETLRLRKDGSLVPISLSVSPILDESGQVVGASKIARDITDRKLAEAHVARVRHRDAFLAQVTLTLTKTLDYEQTLKTLASIVVPSISDYCAIDVVDDDGEMKRMAIVHVDPERAELAEEVSARYDDPTEPSSPASVLRSQLPSLIPDITEGRIVSYMAVPMVTRHRPLGVLTLANAESGRRFTNDDLRLAEDVASRAALAIENAQSYQQMQTANRLKDEFLATLSHELRTPLNAVLGYAQILQSGAMPDKVPQALDVIDRNAKALAQIVEDVLDVSRIILGKTRLRLEEIDIVDIVEGAIATVTPAIDAKGLHLQRHFQRRIGPITGDPNRLQQVVWNLLSNAVKFTPRGGYVDVRAESKESQVFIVVSDSGIGLPSTFLPHVFERFRQAEGGAARRHGGLGLGLAIARHIVEMHGGTIVAESEGEGKGATFTVMLPLIETEAKASRDATSVVP